ncbi:MAG TPA: alpha-glucosidase/alpha-galactosidase [Chloroflexota bacterium]|nr:alpha-glucosidase/alpha-galactosidase [Chloroflexota bacterium]
MARSTNGGSNGRANGHAGGRVTRRGGKQRPKVAMIGAGSVVFAKRLMTDILSWPSLQNAEIALMDIHQGRLDMIHALGTRLVKQEKLGAKITKTTDRRVALEGADYVISMIQVGGLEMYEHDVEIPRRYGIDQTVGDTLGPGGVFRGLRTIPVLTSIAKDIEELCPRALFINYSNPMNINMWAVSRSSPEVLNVGLCHSVQGTAERLARFMEVPFEEVSFWCAGINHQAWYLELRRGHGPKSEDLYPLLREKMEDPAVFEKDRVRFEVMRHFGYFVTESTHHMSEYVPWFRTTQEQIERFTNPRWDYFEICKDRRDPHFERMQRQAKGQEPVETKRTHEYCSHILNAMETNVPYVMNGNVQNVLGRSGQVNGGMGSLLISNLPPNCSVEVPILVDGSGLRPCAVGDLPEACAAINRTNVNVQALAVEGALTGDREMIHRAVQMDPLTAALLPLHKSREMVDELFKAEAEYLPQFKKQRGRTRARVA